MTIGFVAFGQNPVRHELSAAVSLRIQSLRNTTLPAPINCWGVVLWTMGFTDSVRPGLKSELLADVNSPACRKLSEQEPVHPGDIGSIYTSSNGIEHSYVIIDEQQIFEKYSPYVEDQPHIVTAESKFGQKMDLRSGCKKQEGTTCSWGIVNYRCDTAIIERETRQALLEVRSEKERMQILIGRLKDASLGDSPSAVAGAFAQYLDFLRHLMFPDSQSKYRSQLALEAYSRLLLFLNPADQIKKLSTENLTQLLELMDGYDKVEKQTPKMFSDFPNGSLKE